MDQDPWQRVRAALLDSGTLVRAVASGRQRGGATQFRRVEARYVDLNAGLRLQVTSYDDTQAFTRNAEPGPDVDRLVDDLLAAGYATWHVEGAAETLQLRVTKKGRPLLHAVRTAGDEQHVPERRHDRAKQRRLGEADPVFSMLGITTSEGVVKPTRAAKFRQVQDLLAAIDPLVDDAVTLGPGSLLGPERPLRVVDLGCGNAYLTFGAFRYLAAGRGLPVGVTGVDVKSQARRHNADIADRLGVGGQVRFVEGTIGEVELPEPPDLVLALHACDTATDEALARAVAWRTPVVVAAPCCHHDIARQLSAETTPEAYRLVTRHGILRERLADVLTDAFRAALLRLVGYRVEVIDFVDSRHTPRNTLIRAVHTGAPAAPATWNAYRELVSQWQVTPALEVLLRDAVPDLHDTLG